MLSIMEKEPMTDRDEYCSYLTKKLHFESRHDPERIGGTVREMKGLFCTRERFRAFYAG